MFQLAMSVLLHLVVAYTPVKDSIHIPEKGHDLDEEKNGNHVHVAWKKKFLPDKIYPPKKKD